MGTHLLPGGWFHFRCTGRTINVSTQAAVALGHSGSKANRATPLACTNPLPLPASPGTRAHCGSACDPRPPRGRPLPGPGSATPSPGCCCDPRPPGGRPLRARGPARSLWGNGCDPRQPRGTAAASDAHASRAAGPGCDPRLPRGTAAASVRPVSLPGGLRVAILGRPGGRPLPDHHTGAVPSRRVAILGRLGGRPLPEAEKELDDTPIKLRSLAAPEDGRFRQ